MSRIKIKQHLLETDKYFHAEIYDFRLDWIKNRFPELYKEVELFLIDFYNYYIDKDVLITSRGLFNLIYHEKFPEIGLDYYKFSLVKKYMENINKNDNIQ